MQRTAMATPKRSRAEGHVCKQCRALVRKHDNVHNYRGREECEVGDKSAGGVTIDTEGPEVVGPRYRRKTWLPDFFTAPGAVRSFVFDIGAGATLARYFPDERSYDDAGRPFAVTTHTCHADVVAPNTLLFSFLNPTLEISEAGPAPAEQLPPVLLVPAFRALAIIHAHGYSLNTLTHENVVRGEHGVSIDGYEGATRQVDPISAGIFGADVRAMKLMFGKPAEDVEATAADVARAADAHAFADMPDINVWERGLYSAYRTMINADRGEWQSALLDEEIKFVQQRIDFLGGAEPKPGEEQTKGAHMRDLITQSGALLHLMLKAFVAGSNVQKSMPYIKMLAERFQPSVMEPQQEIDAAAALAPLRFVYDELDGVAVPMSIGTLFLAAFAFARGVRSSSELNIALAREAADVLRVFPDVLLNYNHTETLYAGVVATYYRRADVRTRMFYPPFHMQHAPLFIAVNDFFFYDIAPPRVPAALVLRTPITPKRAAAAPPPGKRRPLTFFRA